MAMSNALRFEFADLNSAVLAWGMLQELGYTPVRDGATKVHIHLEENGDLTSALEIAMAYGGRLLEQQPIQDNCLTDSAYELDTIPIPAHIVNEDWELAYTQTDPEAADELHV